MTKKPTIEAIHRNLWTGQLQEMASQIGQYGPEFWEDYVNFIWTLPKNEGFSLLADVVIAYHNIKSK